MKPDEFPAGTRAGWILAACVGILIFSYAIWVGYSRRKERQREETLALQLISKFHEEFNLASVSPAAPESNPLLAKILEVRSHTGKFRQLGSCKIAGTAEPPSLSARCISSFDAGEAEEIFMFHDFDGDNRVVRYSADLVAQTNSPNAPTQK